jgi:microcystin-dependent protein
MTEPYLGEIRLFSFGFTPEGWAVCNVQLLSINQNDALFNLIGTTYGGDGVNTFALPNLEGRVPVHMGRSPSGTPYVMGQVGGSETETLSEEQLPAHRHTVIAHKGTATSSKPVGNVPAATSADIYGATPNADMNSGMIGATGGSQPISIVQPYLTLNFCIALQGIFPSQG